MGTLAATDKRACHCLRGLPISPMWPSESRLAGLSSDRRATNLLTSYIDILTFADSFCLVSPTGLRLPLQIPSPNFSICGNGDAWHSFRDQTSNHF